MSSSNWQSFRNFCEEPQRAKMMPTVARSTCRRREIGIYDARLRVKGPKPYSQRSKNAQVSECATALVGLQHRDRHMGKKTVPACLLQPLTPVRNLQLECSERVVRSGDKVLDERVGNASPPARLFPGHRNEISDSVPVSRDFTSKCHLFQMVVLGKQVEASPVRPGKMKRKAVLGAFPRVKPRKISLRLMGPRFPNWLIFHSLDSFRGSDPKGSAVIGLSMYEPETRAS